MFDCFQFQLRTKYLWIVIIGLIFCSCRNSAGNPVTEHTEPCQDAKCKAHELKTLQNPKEPTNQNSDSNHAQPEVQKGPDLESALHGDGSDHIHNKPNPETGSDEPDLDSLLHGGVKHAHSEKDSTTTGNEEFPNMADNLDALLHGGDAHAHSTGSDATKMSHTDSKIPIGQADLDAMLHGGDAHAHSIGSDHSGNTDTDSEIPIGVGDLESMLHGGDAHAHSKEKSKESERDHLPFGAADLDALLHGGDTHAHDNDRKNNEGAFLPDVRDSRPIGVQDPEELLHGGNGHHSHIVRQAVKGSRPLGGSDPDDAVDDQSDDVTIGTLRAEDVDDYRQWKSEKIKMDAEKKDSKTGWFDGFSYISDTLLFDLQTVKQRYLAKLWNSGGENSKIEEMKVGDEAGTASGKNEDTKKGEENETSKGKEGLEPKLPHDEA